MQKLIAIGADRTSSASVPTSAFDPIRISRNFATSTRLEHHPVRAFHDLEGFLPISLPDNRALFAPSRNEAP
jgi:hypothetical protein